MILKLGAKASLWVGLLFKLKDPVQFITHIRCLDLLPEPVQLLQPDLLWWVSKKGSEVIFTDLPKEQFFAVGVKLIHCELSLSGSTSDH